MWYAHLPGCEGPGSGDRRKVVLQDMALLTGATVITGAMGRKLNSATVADLGCADRAKDGLVLIPDRMPHGLRIPFLRSQPVLEGQMVWSRNRPLWHGLNALTGLRMVLAEHRLARTPRVGSHPLSLARCIHRVHSQTRSVKLSKPCRFQDLRTRRTWSISTYSFPLWLCM